MLDTRCEYFGRFKLHCKIGGGRFSQVFRAQTPEKQSSSAQIVALKTDSVRFESGLPKQNLVLREANLLSQLTHPSLCTVHEQGTINNCAYFAMHFVEGCTLRALMRWLSVHRATLPISSTLAIAHQLSDVLDYVHRRGAVRVAHMDLSPQNIIVARDGSLKLIDFGIARFLDEDVAHRSVGTVAGTAGYMAPEQARGEPSTDERADQFGLGILLWELLTGRRLYNASGDELRSQMRCGCVDVEAPGILRHVSSEIVCCITRLLSSNSDHRFDSMCDVLGAFTTLRSSPSAGQGPLSALVARLLDNEPQFDPYDQRGRAQQMPACDAA